MANYIENVTAPDPFNPDALRLDLSYIDTVAVRKLLTKIPVRKPHHQEFVRVHPEESYRLPVWIIEDKEDREFYLITPSIAREMPDECTPAILFTTINRQGVLLLWPVKLPGLDGKENEWHRSAKEAAEKAITGWLKIKPNMSLGAYELLVATGDLPEPEWPDVTFQEILKIALRDHYVDRLDHPLIKRLLGEV